MRRQSLALLIVMILAPPPAMAQEAAPTPADAPEEPGCALHPAPSCRFFGLTEFGVAFGATRRTRSLLETDVPARQVVIEGGVMRNVGVHDAAGITWFLAQDVVATSTGPGVRYRRWLTQRQSLDAGAGVSIASSDYKFGTVIGVIRYSPAPWLGFTVRPEWIRADRLACDIAACKFLPDDHFRLLAGGDLGGPPGAKVMAAYGFAAGVVMILLVLAYR